MRTSLLVLFIATAAAPSLAASQPKDLGQSWRAKARAQAAERRAEPAERNAGTRTESEAPQAIQARPRRSVQAPAGPLLQPQDLVPRRGRTAGDEEAGQDGGTPAAGGLMPRRAPQADNLDSIRDWRSEERRQLRDVRVGTRPGSRRSAVIKPPPDARPDVQAPAPVRAIRHGDDRRTWHREWRGDRRYDWRRHRERNRWLFNLGYYYDPFGWSYRRYPVGWRLWPSYYQYDHWLHDSWRYRLPPAYGRYRWVRYWDDALLVDIYSGRVVDVIYDFFW